MVIREILELVDKEIAAARQQQTRLESAKLRILACCRKEEAGEGPDIAGRVGECQTRTATARRKAA